jgi:hypothetical protein
LAPGHCYLADAFPWANGLKMEDLEQFAGVIKGDMGAAVRLGVAPSTLRSQIKRFGVVAPRHC